MEVCYAGFESRTTLSLTGLAALRNDIAEFYTSGKWVLRAGHVPVPKPVDVSNKDRKSSLRAMVEGKLKMLSVDQDIDLVFPCTDEDIAALGVPQTEELKTVLKSLKSEFPGSVAKRQRVAETQNNQNEDLQDPPGPPGPGGNDLAAGAVIEGTGGLEVKGYSLVKSTAIPGLSDGITLALATAPQTGSYRTLIHNTSRSTVKVPTGVSCCRCRCRRRRRCRCLIL